MKDCLGVRNDVGRFAMTISSGAQGKGEIEVKDLVKPGEGRVKKVANGVQSGICTWRSNAS
jgi:hypothetical protein